MNAKISGIDLDRLTFALAPLDSEERRAMYKRGDYPRAALTKDLAMRYRWDLFWLAVAAGFKFSKEYNNAHVDTALRRIVVDF
jgi:hypothetical protein